MLKCTWYDSTVIRWRSGTSDENVIKEVIDRQCYRKKSINFQVGPGECWIDLGANCGAFALYCKLEGVSEVHSFEPDTDTFAILSTNSTSWKSPTFKSFIYNQSVTGSRQQEIDFFVSDQGKYSRGSIYSVRTLPLRSKVQNTCFTELSTLVKRSRVSGIKMDIEGSEFDILDSISDLIPSDKLVLEYHLSRDSSVSKLKSRLESLQDRYKTVSYPPEFDRIISAGKDKKTFFDRMIFCKDLRSV